MRPLERELLLRFTGTATGFTPTEITNTGYQAFNTLDVPALESLEAQGYLRITGRLPNHQFPRGGPYAAIACALTPAGEQLLTELRGSTQ